MAPEKNKESDGQELRSLLSRKLQELCDSGARFTKTVSFAAKRVADPDLRRGFLSYAERAGEQAERFEQMIQGIGIKPQKIQNQAIRGWALDVERDVKDIRDKASLDAALTVAVRSALRYGAGGCGSAASWAALLDEDRMADSLEEMVEEMAEAEERLGDLAESKIDKAVLGCPSGDECGSGNGAGDDSDNNDEDEDEDDG